MAIKLNIPAYTKHDNPSYLYHQASRIDAITENEDGTFLEVGGNKVKVDEVFVERYQPAVGQIYVRAADDKDAELGDAYTISPEKLAEDYTPLPESDLS